MSKFASAVLVEMLRRMFGILKIVSLANLDSTRGSLVIPLLGALVSILVIVTLLVTRLANKHVKAGW